MRRRVMDSLLGFVAVWSVLRRLGLRWGAIHDEVHRTLPGDHLLPHPMLETTHAISIAAPRSTVWPWLVQMGFHRAGWYTDSWYSLVDRYLFRIDRSASADRVLPQLQHLEVGDTVPDDPKGETFFTVAVLEPERALVLYSTTHVTGIVPRTLRDDPKLGFHGEFSWAFILEDATRDSTRLILRSRANSAPRLFAAFNSLFLPPADFLIVRLMLKTIKQRVEEESHPTLSPKDTSSPRPKQSTEPKGETLPTDTVSLMSR